MVINIIAAVASILVFSLIFWLMLKIDEWIYGKDEDNGK